MKTLIIHAFFRVSIIFLTFGVQAAEIRQSQTITLNGSDWRLATDPDNKGRDEKWFEVPRKEAKPTPVPWVIQNIFPGYHGVAWYWREFKAPANPHQNGRYLLRFGAVDYLAEVWVNGQPVGGHEGGETPFTLDVTKAVRAGKKNLLAVRVLNPREFGVVGHHSLKYPLKQTPSGDKHDYVASNVMFNSGGIVESVEFLIVPPIYVTNLQVLPNWKTGEIQIRTSIHNAVSPADIVSQFAVTFDKGRQTINTSTRTTRAENGDSVLETSLRVPDHRLWTIEDPFLYRVTANVQVAGSSSVDRPSVRCGFRDFRFENGYFRLNGKRIFLKGAYYLSYFPITYEMPHDPELIRRDVENIKKGGYNFVRITLRSSMPQMLELCDEVGLLILEEHYGAWQLEDSPAMKSRWNYSISEVVLRDRNHPSIVMWGLLNEMGAGPVFQHAVASLPMIRELDQSRMVVLNSGRFDHCADIGSMSNPGAISWEGKSSDLPDIHTYPMCPLSEGTINTLRTYGKSGRAFLSEYGQCGTMDLPSELAQFKRLGQEHSDDARWYRRQMDLFMADWKRWRLDEIWKRPENYFADGHRNYARIKEPGETAFRSNPYLVAYSPTHLVADHHAGCGLMTLFREPKDTSLFDGARLVNARLRWCLFATPNNVYRGSRVRFEAVLADEDTLQPGMYPVRVEVLGPNRKPLITREIQVRIEDSVEGRERPFAVPAFDEVISVDGAAGAYEFVTTMSSHKEIPGGRLTFHVDDPGAMPAMPREVMCWNGEAVLTNWLAERGVKAVAFDASLAGRQVIVVGAKLPVPGGAEAFGKLTRCIARGSVVVFLDHAIFADGKNAVRWLPVEHKQLVGADWCGSYYRAERWVRHHPIFESLPAGGMMDYSFYSSLISNPIISSFEVTRAPWTEISEEIIPSSGELAKPSLLEPKLEEVVCGATRTSSNYISGMHIAIYKLGAGHFILNTLNIMPNLGRHPAAERLLRNILNYAAREIDKPLADLPADFDKQLETMGYK
ncbi:MAG: glycoside hydrolase family 2 TIM barrel-domain containing protein [Kiritimatiellae bacterium]|nr:glycoside hydrolase family 2 TIM barrel-domain containing protein [Kiritimatiellia bacterium]MDD5522909.1 glycoside hydrolase family 2 TIM barrel-domain containing protein [Kiritimatiellia bacterium]